MAKANITPADYSNEFLLIHTLNCDKQLGKCSVPGCGIAKGVFEYLLGKRELLKDTIYPIFKRSFVEESSGKRRKLRDGERERLLLPYPPRPDDFIKKEVEYTLSSDSKGSLSSPNLVECLTNDQLRKYLYSLKIRPLQTLYGPLILSLMQHKENRDMFNVPVDPVKLNIPYYFTVIKNPMDLGTIRDRLSSGYYKEAKEIERDIELVFSNAMTFNPKENVVHIAAQKLLRFYHSELEKIHQKNDQSIQQHRNHSCPSCNGYPCSLCSEKCIKYSPFVLVCDGPCRQKILRNSNYYLIRGYPGKYCQKCCVKVLNDFVKSDRKRYLVKKKNDLTIPESWIQCSQCHKFIHASCGLIHIRQSSQSYVCPHCLLNTPRRSLSTPCSARDLQETKLTQFIKEQLDKRICTEYLKYMNDHHQTPSMKDMEHIQQSLFVRLLSNVHLQSQVKDCIIPLYQGKEQESLSIPYTSKCIALFQNVDGYDVLLFVLYVYEYGTDPVIPLANQRTVYISYLDSIHYMKPRYIRTPLYHEILQAYMLYCKQHGYIRTHIWACPPSRGDDYIFTHHPREQRTPNANRLITWYKDMLYEGKKRGVLFDIRSQLDTLLEVNTSFNLGQNPCEDLHFKSIFSFKTSIPAISSPPSVEDDKSSIDTSTSTYSSTTLTTSTSSLLSARNGSIASDSSLGSNEYEPEGDAELESDASMPIYISSNPSLLTPPPPSSSSHCQFTSSSSNIPSPRSDTNITSIQLLSPSIRLKCKKQSKTKPKSKPKLKPKKYPKGVTLASSLPYGYLTYQEERLMKILPYYEGDYWPYVCDGLLKDIYEDECKGKFNACLKNPTKPSSKSKIEQTEYEIFEAITRLPSEILRRYAKSMLENPNRFLIVYLYPYCVHCGESINTNPSVSTTGVYYQCYECSTTDRPFYLCEHCIHTSISHCSSHHLYPMNCNIVPFTPDDSPIISNEFVNKRSDFLKYCQGNFLQFDSLKHSILSTSFLLNCIFHQPKDLYIDTCDGCECILYNVKYICKYCHNYKLCENCIKHDGGLHIYNHRHQLQLNTNSFYSDK